MSDRIPFVEKPDVSLDERSGKGASVFLLCRATFLRA
jgi:hypothetical protein